MQEVNNEKERRNETKSILPFRKYKRRLRQLFRYWLIAAVIIGIINVGCSFGVKYFTGIIYTVVNFSYDGIESGTDPNGNKFDVNMMKSEDIIRKSLDDIGATDVDPAVISSNISIDGIIPGNVISRITQYTPMFSSDEIVTSKNILDTSYYPTQYKIELQCDDIGMNKKTASEFLNKLTENYYTVFYNTFGYNNSLESAVTSIDYNDYDYIDAVDVFTASLRSLQNYIKELESKDMTRFRSSNGFTFSDISASIDTICDEDLELIASYITVNNITKDKDNLIAKYEFRIENLKRRKKVAEETIEALERTIESYEKDSILILSNATDSSGASLTQSSATYNNLITQKISNQSNLSSCEQNINLYNKRIKSLKTGTENRANSAVVEEKFKNINEKISALIVTTNETASEYYENVLLSNAYNVLSKANSSMFLLLKESVRDSVRNVFTFELLLTSLYLAASAVLCFVRLPGFLKKKEAAQKDKKSGREKKSVNKKKKS